MFNRLAPLLPVLLLSACASTPDMKVMSPSTRTDCFVLTEPMSYSGKKGIGTFESGLFADTYRAVLEDEDGVYYRGMGDGYWFRGTGHPDAQEESLVTRAPGGIWMPKKADKKPSMFMHEDLSGRGPIERHLAKKNHDATKAGLAPATPSAATAANTPGLVNQDPGKTSVVANAAGGAIAEAILSGYLASQNGRIVMMDWEGDSGAFWSGIASKRTNCAR